MYSRPTAQSIPPNERRVIQHALVHEVARRREGPSRPAEETIGREALPPSPSGRGLRDALALEAGRALGLLPLLDADGVP